jgi:cation:H+ antiporter
MEGKEGERAAPLPHRAPHPPAAYALLSAAVGIGLAGAVVRLCGVTFEDVPVVGMFVFGAAIVGAAFVLTWAAEVAQVDVGSGLAVVFLALVTVLPEYAVDMLLAWQGASDPHLRELALANMTGANRLLIGTGWPVVALIVWYRRGQREVHLRRDRSPDVFWLLAATLYSAVVPLKGDLAWYDALILISMYASYVYMNRGAPEEHAELVGPPQVMVALPQRKRRQLTLVLFLVAAGVILACAESFVHSLIQGGRAMGIDEVFLVQWLAPLASESPEFVVVVLLTIRGRPDMGLAAFVSSKVNQWTLLVGGVPLAYGLAGVEAGTGWTGHMPLSSRQTEELWLTISQGLYATAAISDLRFSLRQALVILVLFLVQLVGSIVLEATGHHDAVSPFHFALSILYVLLAIERFYTERKDVRQRVVDTFRRRTPDA